MPFWGFGRRDLFFRDGFRRRPFFPIVEIEIERRRIEIEIELERRRRFEIERRRRRGF
ncbi:hypothetical protein [Neobacillus drentensis]|uniref:hypothetical protein n=1 Tax=Neobacillus drentensis TaxID=220684 RepID=UPI002FFD73A9